MKQNDISLGLQGEVDQLKTKNSDLTRKWAALAQEIHDLRSHIGTFAFCMQDQCYDSWVAVKQLRTTQTALQHCRVGQCSAYCTCACSLCQEAKA